MRRGTGWQCHQVQTQFQKTTTEAVVATMQGWNDQHVLWRQYSVPSHPIPTITCALGTYIHMHTGAHTRALGTQIAMIFLQWKFIIAAIIAIIIIIIIGTFQWWSLNHTDCRPSVCHDNVHIWKCACQCRDICISTLKAPQQSHWWMERDNLYISFYLMWQVILTSDLALLNCLNRDTLTLRAFSPPLSLPTLHLHLNRCTHMCTPHDQEHNRLVLDHPNNMLTWVRSHNTCMNVRYTPQKHTLMSTMHIGMTHEHTCMIGHVCISDNDVTSTQLWSLRSPEVEWDVRVDDLQFPISIL